LPDGFLENIKEEFICNFYEFKADDTESAPYSAFIPQYIHNKNILDKFTTINILLN